MFKKLLLILACSLPMMLLAQEQTITVNGQKVEGIAVRLTFDGDNVVIHFEDGTETSAEMENTTIDISSTTDNIEGLNSAFAVKGNIVGDKLFVSGLSDGEPMSLISAGGYAVAKTTAKNGRASLSLAGLPKGVYLIKVGNKIIKFHKD